MSTFEYYHICFVLNVENCPYVVVLLLILMHICGFFVALGSYKTSQLGGKPRHQRIPIIGARRVHVHE